MGGLFSEFIKLFRLLLLLLLLFRLLLLLLLLFDFETLDDGLIDGEYKTENPLFLLGIIYYIHKNIKDSIVITVYSCIQSASI
jgi:hypothetical protein